MTKHSLSDPSEITPSTADGELVERLCDLHARLLSCFKGGAGRPPPRRPWRLEPKWVDCDTVLDAAVALQRIDRIAALEAEIERKDGALRLLVKTCETDERQGYRSTLRTYVLEIARQALSPTIKETKG